MTAMGGGNACERQDAGVVHPHVHPVVPGGAVNRRRKQWQKVKGKYLFNERALARVFRARLLAAIKQAGLTIPNKLPAQWVADVRHVGQGLSALQYLSRYLYRGVISENNIVSNRDGRVTFKYIDSKTNTTHPDRSTDLIDDKTGVSQWP